MKDHIHYGTWLAITAIVVTIIILIMSIEDHYEKTCTHCGRYQPWEETNCGNCGRPLVERKAQ